MIAKLQVSKNSYGTDFDIIPQPVDLDRFSVEDVRERLVDYGYSYDVLVRVVEIVDWELIRTIWLNDIPILQRVIKIYYDGDPSVVISMLKSIHPQYTINECGYDYYKYAGSSDEELLETLEKHPLTAPRMQKVKEDCYQLLKDEKQLIRTEKGYYIKSGALREMGIYL